MRTRLVLAALAVALIAPSAQAQSGRDSGIRTETQERLASQSDENLPFNIIGLLGLFGLIGLRRGHAEDSYHPANME